MPDLDDLRNDLDDAVRDGRDWLKRHVALIATHLFAFAAGGFLVQLIGG